MSNWELGRVGKPGSGIFSSRMDRPRPPAVMMPVGTWDIEFRGTFQRVGRNREEAMANAKEFLEHLLITHFTITKVERV